MRILIKNYLLFFFFVFSIKIKIIILITSKCAAAGVCFSLTNRKVSLVLVPVLSRELFDPLDRKLGDRPCISFCATVVAFSSLANNTNIRNSGVGHCAVPLLLLATAISPSFMLAFFDTGVRSVDLQWGSFTTLCINLFRSNVKYLKLIQYIY